MIMINQPPCYIRLGIWNTKWGLINHYHLIFDKKLGRFICDILHIPCACVGCTSMLEKRWISGIPSKKQACYQPVTDCTYWTVLR